VHIGINLLGARGSHLSLLAASVRFTKEDRAREISQFDFIEINDEDMANAHKNQIFNYLVAQCTRPNYQNLCVFHFFTIPPRDEIECALAVLLQVRDHHGFFRGNWQTLWSLRRFARSSALLFN